MLRSVQSVTQGSVQSVTQGERERTVLRPGECRAGGKQQQPASYGGQHRRHMWRRLRGNDHLLRLYPGAVTPPRPSEIRLAASSARAVDLLGYWVLGMGSRHARSWLALA
jgi:hypothetical protein